MSLVFIDARNQLHRCYHTGKHLTRADGFPTGAVYGCLNHSLLAIARRIPDASFVWVWDGVGDTWRHRMMAQLPQLDSTQFPDTEDEEDEPLGQASFSSNISSSLQFIGVYNQPTRRKKSKIQGYKAQRHRGSTASSQKSKYPIDDRSRALIQMPILRLILEASGFRQFEVEGLEADDLLAMLTIKAMELDSEEEIIILSGDRDYYQLLKYDNVKLTTGLKEGKIKWVTTDDVKNIYGIDPKDWTKYRAFTGDASDNIPHLHKVGSKTALKMLADGLDPSNPDYHHIDVDAREVYARYFQPQGIKTLWPAVFGNWKLCEFVIDPESSLLSEAVQEKLHHIFGHLTSIKKFRRRSSCLTHENYRKVSFLMGQYELNSILAQMDQFWQIP